MCFHKSKRIQRYTLHVWVGKIHQLVNILLIVRVYGLHRGSLEHMLGNKNKLINTRQQNKRLIKYTGYMFRPVNMSSKTGPETYFAASLMKTC